MSASPSDESDLVVYWRLVERLGGNSRTRGGHVRVDVRRLREEAIHCRRERITRVESDVHERDSGVSQLIVRGSHECAQYFPTVTGHADVRDRHAAEGLPGVRHPLASREWR